MFTISKLAEAAETTPDTIRYYEREDLLPPAERSGSQYRLYDQGSLVQLRFIRQAQSCGFTLAEIRTLLALRQSGTACCGEVKAQVAAKKREVDAKIHSLQAMSKVLGRLIGGCSDGAELTAACPILTAFEQVDTSEKWEE